MTGFESVGKAAEEASPEFRAQGFFRAIWMAIFIGILFYASIVAAVAFVAPWRKLTGEKFMTAVAFQQALRLALDRANHSRCRFALAIQMFQRKLRRRQPIVLRVGAPRHGRLARWSGPHPVSHSIHRGPVRGPRHGCLHAARRRDPRASHRGRIRSLCHRMVRHLRRVPCPGSRPARSDYSVVHRARNRVVRTGSRNRDGPDESRPARPRPLHNLRMDRPGRVDRDRSHRSRSSSATWKSGS